MSLLNMFRREQPKAVAPQVHAQSEAGAFIGFDDPRLKEWMRNGGEAAGSPLSVKVAMRNTAVFRCVSLISYTMGMLPMHVINTETKEKARENGLFKLLHSRPNDWQTAFNFRQYMQRNALVHGNAYALVIRSMGRVVRLIPLDPTAIRVKQNRDWSVEYHYTPKQGDLRILKPQDVLHVYADTDDGISGTSMVKIAATAIDLARELENSQLKFFKNGMLLGGMFTHPEKISPEAHARLKMSMQAHYSGTDNAGKWIIGEEGMTPHQFTSTAKDGQQHESRLLQIEEIGRVFGVPRPFLGLDDTSWGSGIDILGQILVRYALNPWFTAWEQAIKRSCMTDEEQDQLEVKFNAGALLRGSMKDQAEFFTKALGSGGHQPWMDYVEVRDTMDLPEKDIAPNPLAQKGNGNEPKNTA